jgi:hypothetical protein
MNDLGSLIRQRAQLCSGEKGMQHTEVCVSELQMIEIRAWHTVRPITYRLGLFVQVNNFPKEDVNKHTKIVRVEVF